MLSSKDEAHFLFSNAAKIRSMARQGPSAIKEDLLTLARALEARATELEARDLASGDHGDDAANPARNGLDRAEDDRA